jgi:hypothetical protein
VSVSQIPNITDGINSLGAAAPPPPKPPPVVRPPLDFNVECEIDKGQQAQPGPSDEYMKMLGLDSSPPVQGNKQPVSIPPTPAPLYTEENRELAIKNPDATEVFDVVETKEVTLAKEIESGIKIGIYSTKTYIGKALIVFLLYYFGLGFGGFYFNWLYLEDARECEKITGKSPPGKSLLSCLFWIHLITLIILIIAGCTLAFLRIG